MKFTSGLNWWVYSNFSGLYTPPTHTHISGHNPWEWLMTVLHYVSIKNTKTKHQCFLNPMFFSFTSATCTSGFLGFFSGVIGNYEANKVFMLLYLQFKLEFLCLFKVVINDNFLDKIRIQCVFNHLCTPIL